MTLVINIIFVHNAKNVTGCQRTKMKQYKDYLDDYCQRKWHISYNDATEEQQGWAEIYVEHLDD
jgi:hypothetical protein